MLVKRGTAEDVYAVVLQRLSDTAKTGLFESQSPGVEPHTRWQHIRRRRHREPMGSTFANGTPCVMADAQRGH